MAFDKCVITTDGAEILPQILQGIYEEINATVILCTGTLTSLQARNITADSVFSTSVGGSAGGILNSITSIGKEVNIYVKGSQTGTEVRGNIVCLNLSLGTDSYCVACFFSDEIIRSLTANFVINIEETNNVIKATADFDGNITQGILDKILEHHGTNPSETSSELDYLIMPKVAHSADVSSTDQITDSSNTAGVIFSENQDQPFEHYVENPNAEQENAELEAAGWTLTNAWQTNGTVLYNGEQYALGNLGGSETMYYKYVSSIQDTMTMEEMNAILGEGMKFTDTFYVTEYQSGIVERATYNTQTGYFTLSEETAVGESQVSTGINQNNTQYSVLNQPYPTINDISSFSPYTAQDITMSTSASVENVSSGYTLNGTQYSCVNNDLGLSINAGDYWMYTQNGDSSSHLPYGGTESGFFCVINMETMMAGDPEDPTMGGTYTETTYAFMSYDDFMASLCLTSGTEITVPQNSTINPYGHSVTYRNDGNEVIRIDMPATNTSGTKVSPYDFFTTYQSQPDVTSRLETITSQKWGMSFSSQTSISFTQGNSADGKTTSASGNFRMTNTLNDVYIATPKASSIQRQDTVNLWNTYITNRSTNTVYVDQSMSASQQISGSLILGTAQRYDVMTIQNDNVTINGNLTVTGTVSYEGSSSQASNNTYSELYVSNLYIGGTGGIQMNKYQDGIDFRGNLNPFSNNQYSLGSDSYAWKNIYGCVQSLAKDAAGGLYFFKLELTVDGNSVDIPRGTLLSSFSSLGIEITSYTEQVDDTSHNGYSGTGIPTGDYKTLIRFTASSGRYFIPCLRVL